ncbi:MAG: hypothetical protein CYG59_04780, partial [Chloroflexi bacterium]
MCRLLSYVTRSPVMLRELLGDGLEEFQQLSHLHDDGWGLAAYDEQGRLICRKAPEPAHSSPAFADLIEKVRTDTLLVHLRRATPGLSLRYENTHPFTVGSYAFAHNGRIWPVGKIEDLIDRHHRRHIQGTTDSERFFLALLSACETMPAEEAIQRLLSDTRKDLNYTSLNSILMTPDAMYAICCYDPDHPIVSEELQQDPAYYTLHYSINPHAVVVSS